MFFFKSAALFLPILDGAFAGAVFRTGRAGKKFHGYGSGAEPPLHEKSGDGLAAVLPRSEARVKKAEIGGAAGKRGGMEPAADGAAEKQQCGARFHIAADCFFAAARP